MRKEDRKLFLDELEKTPIVSVVCQKLSLSRQTVYRWRVEDSHFKEKFDEALGRGRDSINDLAESKLISQVNQENMRAIEFWLRNNKVNYRQPKPPFYGDIAHSELDKYRNAILELIEQKRKEINPESERIMANPSFYKNLSTEEILEMALTAMEEKDTEEFMEMVRKMIEKRKGLK